MDSETVIRREIAQLELTNEVRRLRALTAALDALTEATAMRVKMPRPLAVIRKKSGLPNSWARALKLLDEQGLPFAEYRDRYEHDRGSPIAEASFAAQLSKMKGANLIHKRGDRWFAGRQRNDPGAAPSAETPGSSTRSNEEAQDAIIS